MRKTKLVSEHLGRGGLTETPADPLPNEDIRASEMEQRVMVIGIGGAGSNAINNMIRLQLQGVDFMAVNTDAAALRHSLASQRIQLGVNITRGLGAGSRPDIGRAAAIEALPNLIEHIKGARIAFIVAGMGGGTGTGAAPVVAKACRDLGILTVGIVSKPFQFEGIMRMRLADAGIKEIEQCVDTLIVSPNQNLFLIANEKTTFADAFSLADDRFYFGVRSITDLITTAGLINLDLADVRAAIGGMGKAAMGVGEGEGDNRALNAAEAAIANLLADDASMKSASGVLINITGGHDMSLFEVDEAANRIRAEVDEETHIIFGAVFDESLKGRVRISVIAAGIMNAKECADAQRPVFLDAVVSGLGSVTYLFRSKRYGYPHASPIAALRSDWVRIGQDFRKAVEQVHGTRN